MQGGHSAPQDPSLVQSDVWACTSEGCHPGTSKASGDELLGCHGLGEGFNALWVDL